MNKGQDFYRQSQLQIHDSKDETKMLKRNKSVDWMLMKSVVASMLELRGSLKLKLVVRHCSFTVFSLGREQRKWLARGGEDTILHRTFLTYFL